MAKAKKTMIREARRAYMKEWRKNNSDKLRTYQERYWLKKASELAAKEGE